MYGPLARSDYYRASAPPDAFGGRRTYPTTPAGYRAWEQHQMVPVFTRSRSTRSAPSFAPAASPCLRRRPSAWPPHRHAKPASESTADRRPCTASRPLSTRFEPAPRLRSFITGSSRIPSGLACRTRPDWQSRAVPALSALLPVLPGASRVRLRSAPTRPLRRPSGEVSHLPRFLAPHGAPAPHGAQGLRPRTPGPHLLGVDRDGRPVRRGDVPRPSRVLVALL
jgi:hypothetical protein